MVFFSKNRTTAKQRLKKIGKQNHYPVLAKKQIKHIDGWKTWTYRKKRG